MKRFYLFLLLHCLVKSYAQDQSNYNLSFGSNIEYTLAGDANTIVIGPVLTWEPKNNNKYYQALDMNIGMTWSKDDNSILTTSLGFYKGSLPGIMFGLSSQQYYNAKTKFDTNKTDIRLSGEFIVALFGIIGYRYQHPIAKNNETYFVSRHTFFIKFPIPLKKINKTRSL